MADKKIKKILMISTFPPTHCGIATYAQDHFLTLKKDGHVIFTQSIGQGSAANYNFSNASIKGLLKAIIFNTTSCFDEVYLHFTNGLMWPRSHLKGWRKPVTIILQYLWFLVMALRYGKGFNLIGHEISTGDMPKVSKLSQGIIYACTRNIYVHTAIEKKKLFETFGLFLRDKQVRTLEHGTFLSPKFTGDRSLARHKLGLPQEQCILLCIGFIQHHKGFDTVVDAMASVKDANKHLYVVGSIRVAAPEYKKYRDELKVKIEADEKCSLVESYVDDETFDLWIAAADAIVLPYREIWSSGVGARAQIYQTPVIARNHPNLESQFGDYPHKHVYEGPDSLVECIENLDVKKPVYAGEYLPTKYTDPYILCDKILQQKKILFVMPTFGARVRGGAEGFTYRLALELVRRGGDIEVWTTDSSEVVGRNHESGVNNEDELQPFKIKRFPANVHSEKIFNRVHRYMNQEGRCGSLCRWLWKFTNLHGFGMEEELIARKDEFDVVHLFHYLLGSSHRLGTIAPEKTVIHPFIHDEAPLRNPIMRSLFANSRGVTCNTDAAWDWASQAQCGLVPSLFQPIGNGVEKSYVEIPQSDETLDAFAKDGFLLFIGRLIPEKNILLLLEWHKDLQKKDPNAPHLVFIGEGYLWDHTEIKNNSKAHVLGWVSPAQKAYALKNALALVNLSRLESFSLVLMEAWLEKTPVIVHRECSATFGHIGRSGQAGYGVATATEFVDAVQKLKSMPADEYKHLGELGCKYVTTQYTWDRVCANYTGALVNIFNWIETERAPLAKLGDRVTQKIDRSDFLLRSTLNSDYYVAFEEQCRDGESISESWNYYFENHLKKFDKGATIVDIGAGRGDFLEFLRKKMPDNHYFGVEPDLHSYQSMMERGFGSINMNLNQFCDYAEPFSADVIVMMHVLEHISWPEWALLFSRLKSVLKFGGLLIIELPNAWSMSTNSLFFWQDPTHVRPINPISIDQALTQSGYKVWDKKEFAPHRSADELSRLAEKIGDADLVKSLYGNQDYAFISQRIN